MKTKLILGVFAGMLSSVAWAGPQSFNFSGTLYNAAGTAPLLDSSVQMKLQIYNATQTCLLYQEVQTVDTATTNGDFSLQVGSVVAGPFRTVPDPGLSMATIFQNAGNIAGCYTPASTDNRVLLVTVTPSSTGVANTLSPAYVIDSVPMATVAEVATSLAANSTVPGPLTLGNSGKLAFSNGTNTISLQPPAAFSPSQTLTLPGNPSGPGWLLTNDGTGVLSWAAPNTGVTSTGMDSGFGTAPGGLLTRGASTWQALAPGSPGNVLTMVGSNPAWQPLSPASVPFALINGGNIGPQTLGSTDTSDVSIKSNGTTRMTVFGSNGNVGIGTTLAAYPLTVFGVINSMSGGVRYPDGTTQTTAFLPTPPQWTVSGPNIFYTTGNVGIGLSSPAAALHIMSPSSSAFEVDSSNSTGTVATLYNTASNAAFQLVSSGPSSPYGPGKFYLYDAMAGQARLAVTSTGNVGIGTTAPAATLDVQGPGGFQVGSAITSGVPIQNMRICSGSPGTSGASQSFSCIGAAIGSVASCSYSGSIGGAFTWSSAITTPNTISLTFSGAAAIATWKCLVVN